MAPTLLCLPREILHEILGYVLAVERTSEYIPDPEDSNLQPLCYSDQVQEDNRIEEHTLNPTIQNVAEAQLLQVNHQIREETLAFLTLRNFRINLVVVGRHPKYVRALSGKLAGQQTACKMPWHGLLRDSEVAVVTITVEMFPDLAAPACPTEVVSTLLPYSKRAYAYLCHALWINARRTLSDRQNKVRVQRLKIDIRPGAGQTGVDVKEAFLRPMAMIRDLHKVDISMTPSDPLAEAIEKTMKSSYTLGWRSIIGVQKLWQQRGDQALRERDYGNGVHFYDLGALVGATLIEASLRRSRRGRQSPFFLESIDIASDIHSKYALAVNKLVECRKGESTGVMLRYLNMAVAQASLAFWMGMSRPQQCLAHYRRGIAIENRADHEWLYGPTGDRQWPRVPPFEVSHVPVAGIDDVIHYLRPTASSVSLTPNYQAAARDLHLAWQLSQADSTIDSAVDRVDATIIDGMRCPFNVAIHDALARVEARLGCITTFGDAPTFSCHIITQDPNGRTWAGDSRLADRWNLMAPGLPPWVDLDFQPHDPNKHPKRYRSSYLAVQ